MILRSKSCPSFPAMELNLSDTFSGHSSHPEPYLFSPWLGRSNTCSCTTPSWKRASVATPPSPCASSAPSTTISAGWTPRPTPARSKTNFRYEQVPGSVTQPTSAAPSTFRGFSWWEQISLELPVSAALDSCRMNSRTFNAQPQVAIDQSPGDC